MPTYRVYKLNENGPWKLCEPDAPTAINAIHVALGDGYIIQDILDSQSDAVCRAMLRGSNEAATFFSHLVIEPERINPGEFARRVGSAFCSDYEEAHSEADALMVTILRSYGYGEGCDIFEKAHKWYA